MARDFDPSLAHAAYISGSAYSASAPGSITHDYRSRVQGVKHVEICLPEGAPEWMQGAQELWTAVEAAEKRKDARVAVEILISAPRELSRDGALDCVRSIVNEKLASLGVAAQFAMHETKARDGGMNRHFHCLLSTRAVQAASSTSFAAKKVQGYDKRAFVQGIREDVASALNWQLAQEKAQARVDHRRLAVQLDEALRAGDFAKAATLDRQPEPKLGKAAAALEAKGVPSERGDKLRAVQARNAEVRAAWQSVSRFGPAARQCFMALRLKLGCAIKALEAWREHLTEWAREVRDGFAASFKAGSSIEAAPKAPEPELRAYDQPAPKVYLSTAEKVERAADRDVAKLKRTTREGRSERRLQQEMEQRMSRDDKAVIKGEEDQSQATWQRVPERDGRFVSADGQGTKAWQHRDTGEIMHTKPGTDMNRQLDWREKAKAEREAQVKQRAEEKAQDRAMFGDDWRAAAKARRERERTQNRSQGMSL